MALTDNCDVFGSIREDGVNQVIRHVMRQRPSLFNYGTDSFVSSPRRLCEKVDVHPDVLVRGNPVVTREDPIAIPGTDGQLGLEFCAQLVSLRVDFHPSNAIALPAELNPPLAEQSFAVSGRFCAGLGCPGKRFITRFAAANDHQSARRPNAKDQSARAPRLPPVPVPVERLLCFCVDLYAVAQITEDDGVIGAQLMGLELVDIAPPGLESAIECFMATTLRASVFPKLRVAIDTLVFSLGDWITLVPTGTSASVPHNPSIAQDAVSVFLDVT